MALCAEIWTMKTHEVLDEGAKRLKKLIDKRQSMVEAELEPLAAHVKAAEETVAKAKMNLELRVVEIVEDRSKSGTPVDFTNADKVVVGQKSDERVLQLRTAEAELDRLRNKRAFLRAWFAALPIVRTRVDACVNDQRGYLDPRKDGATTTGPEDIEVDKPEAGITRVSGSWQGGCVDEANARSEHGGKVTLDISPEEEIAPDEGSVTGKFDFDGETTPVKGTWYKKVSTISVTGTLRGHSWGLTGRVETSGGKISVSGDVSGYLTKGSCLGKFTAQ
jgi:hypothetical protein